MWQRLQTLFWLIANLSIYYYMYLFNNFDFDFSSERNILGSTIPFIVTLLLWAVILSFRRRGFQTSLGSFLVFLLGIEIAIRYFGIGDFNEYMIQYGILVLAMVLILAGIYFTIRDAKLVRDSNRLR